jgi:hypothetical protein
MQSDTVALVVYAIRFPVSPEKISGTPEEHHEAHIHVVLLMTVKQRKPRRIRRELYLRIASCLN